MQKEKLKHNDFKKNKQTQDEGTYLSRSKTKLAFFFWEPKASVLKEFKK